uniref:Uncharacterized protein n=1 Tax=Branchiostoma floridae TaxID=7739 RepID=C3XW65_BRAFL|eukprot:XP_002611589.1 hypothetical protein BRAFLDRAFT_63763 [Branchiostoma floridae]
MAAGARQQVSAAGVHSFEVFVARTKVGRMSQGPSLENTLSAGAAGHARHAPLENREKIQNKAMICTFITVTVSVLALQLRLTKFNGRKRKFGSASFLCSRRLCSFLAEQTQL